MKAEKLLKMKKQIEQTDLDIARLQGKLEDRRKQIKNKSGKSKISEVKVILKKLKKKLKDAESKLEKGIKELEEEYDW